MDLDQIKEQLKDSNLRKVAESCGLHYNVVTRLMKGDTDPRYSTVEQLTKYIKERSGADGGRKSETKATIDIGPRAQENG